MTFSPELSRGRVPFIAGGDESGLSKEEYLRFIIPEWCRVMGLALPTVEEQRDIEAVAEHNYVAFLPREPMPTPWGRLQIMKVAVEAPVPLYIATSLAHLHNGDVFIAGENQNDPYRHHLYIAMHGQAAYGYPRRDALHYTIATFNADATPVMRFSSTSSPTREFSVAYTYDMRHTGSVGTHFDVVWNGDLFFDFSNGFQFTCDPHGQVKRVVFFPGIRVVNRHYMDADNGIATRTGFAEVERWVDEMR